MNVSRKNKESEREREKLNQIRTGLCFLLFVFILGIRLFECRENLELRAEVIVKLIVEVIEANLTSNWSI